MTYDPLVYMCFATGVSAILVAGVFQSFSDFVMRSLIAANPAGGIESMQNINIKVFRSVFLFMMLGLVPVSIILAGYAYQNHSGQGLGWIMTGTAIYIVFVFLVTMLGNVPMNNRLAAMHHQDEQATGYWRLYGSRWTRWNHVRMMGALISGACFLWACITLASAHHPSLNGRHALTPLLRIEFAAIAIL